MPNSSRYQIPLLTAAFLGVCGIAQPGVAGHIVPDSVSHSLMQTLPTTAQTPLGPISVNGLQNSSGLQQAMNVQWPSNAINLSQLQSLLTQNPGISQFNLQFPNQSSWGVTPNTVQSLASMFQQSADAVGFTGKLPDLSFSSLAATAVSSGLPQMMIDPKGDIQGQLTDVLRNMRYQSIDLSDALPDWLKRIVLAIYDYAYNTFDYLGQQLAGLITR